MRSLFVLAFLGAVLAWDRSLVAEEVDVVSLEEAKPSETPTPVPTATEAPTPEPAATPVPRVEAASSVPAEKLDEPTFKKGDKAALMDGNDEGLVIIAPGASSPEDSFEAFGIDSPFNWRERKKKKITGPDSKNSLEDESIELNSPETSDFREKVSLENSQGQQVLGLENYDEIERAGHILRKDDFKFDGKILREKDGRSLFGKGDLFYMSVEPGRQVYPGSIYSIFREEGKVKGVADSAEMGSLFRAIAVARVIRVDSENTMARVEKIYDGVKLGDGLRLRDPDRAKHFVSVRQGSGETSPSDLKGQIVALQGLREVATAGNFAYLDVGRTKGAVVGLRLAIYRELAATGEASDELPGPVGKIGELQVISVQRDTATAKITKSQLTLRAGDKIRYR